MDALVLLGDTLGWVLAWVVAAILYCVIVGVGLPLVYLTHNVIVGMAAIAEMFV